LKKTILNEWHRSQKAVMVDFGGWDMPVSYSTLTEEHKAVRQGCGLFDISHMGQVMVRGPRAMEFLQRITTNNVEALGPGRMQYSLLPAEDGTLHDDIIVSRLSEEEKTYFVVVNASNTENDLAWMQAQAKPFEAIVEHLSGWSMFALQGPKADAILQPLTSERLAALPYYHLSRSEIAGVSVILSRSGYTGEDGFEICMRNEDAPAIWERLMAEGKSHGLLPIGLGARNTLRLEMAYALYGHEISRETRPYEAGLGWVVKPAKGDFVGKSAIEAERAPGRRLAGFEMVDRGVARDSYAVLDASGATIGKVTSASPSPSTGKNIGLAYLPLDQAQVGTEIYIDIRGKGVKAKVVKTPFVPSHVRKNQ
jgi:aminomethyltransferase